jgi:hypothetical protein
VEMERTRTCTHLSDSERTFEDSGGQMPNEIFR